MFLSFAASFSRMGLTAMGERTKFKVVDTVTTQN